MKFKKLFKNKEHYLAFRTRWSEIMNSEERKDLKSYHHAFYAIMRDRDWTKGFTPITNRNKLHICMYSPNMGSRDALRCIMGLSKAVKEPFGDLVTTNMVEKAQYLLKGHK